MRYSVAHHSLPGTREVNQDRVAVAERDDLVLMIVADGLGGYDGGELAADTLTEVMINSFERARERVFEDPASFLILSMYFAHTMINKRALKNNIDISSPRTTCVACLVQNGLAYWAHIGDSRLYYIRNNEALFHTTDHTTATRMLEEGIIAEKDVRSENARLLRCVGGTRRHEVTLGPETQMETGDTLLLCTDGVWRALQQRHIERLSNTTTLDNSVVDLLAQVERRARKDCDNISAVLFRWEDEPTSAAPVYGLTVPNINQKDLVQQSYKMNKSDNTKNNSHKRKSLKKTPRRVIQSTIAELESFVTELDSLLEED